MALQHFARGERVQDACCEILCHPHRELAEADLNWLLRTPNSSAKQGIPKAHMEEKYSSIIRFCEVTACSLAACWGHTPACSMHFPKGSVLNEACVNFVWILLHAAYLVLSQPWIRLVSTSCRYRCTPQYILPLWYSLSFNCISTSKNHKSYTIIYFTNTSGNKLNAFWLLLSPVSQLICVFVYAFLCVRTWSVHLEKVIVGHTVRVYACTDKTLPHTFFLLYGGIFLSPINPLKATFNRTSNFCHISVSAVICLFIYSVLFWFCNVLAVPVTCLVWVQCLCLFMIWAEHSPKSLSHVSVISGSDTVSSNLPPLLVCWTFPLCLHLHNHYLPCIM